MKNLNLNEQEKQRGWHDFCSINHANQTEFQADSLSASGSSAVSVTLEECPAKNALITRLSRANHALFPLSRCVNTLIRIGDYVVGGRARRGAGKEVVAMMRQKCMMWKYAAMMVLMLTLGVGEMWGGDVTFYVTGSIFGEAWDDATSTMYVGFNYLSNEDQTGWAEPYEMTNTGKTYNGKTVYQATYGSKNNNAKIFFYHYQNGSQQGSSIQASSGDNWTTSSDASGKLYEGWNSTSHVWSSFSYDKYVSGGYIYFDESAVSNWTDSYTYFLVGRSGFYRPYAIGKLGSTNTKLYYIYLDGASNHTWEDATYSAFFNDDSGTWDKANKEYSDVQERATKKSGTLTIDYSNRILSGTSYLYKIASGDDNNTLSRTVLSGYSDLNKNQTLHIMLSTDGGTTYSEVTTTAASWNGTIKATYTAITGNGTATTYSGETAQTLSSSAYTKGAAITSNYQLDESSTADGYTFVGFNTSNSAPSPSNTTITINNISGENDIYAFFKANSYTISYEGNGSTTGSTANSTHYYGVAKALTTNGFAKEGYTFDGWNTQADGTGTSYTAGQSVSNLSSTEGATVTLYAQWKQVITLDDNGGTSDGSVTVYYKRNSVSDFSEAVKTGYTCNGYYTATTGGYMIFAASTGALSSYSSDISSYVNSDGEWIYNGTPSLHAQWSPNTYTISFNADDASRVGTATNVQTSVTVTYDAKDFSAATVAVPVLAGYTFGGYYTATNGGGEQIVDANGAWITSTKTDYLDASGNWIKADNTTLYAKWTPITYTLSLNANTSGATGGSATVDYGATSLTIGTTPTRAGYYVEGYYADGALTSKVADADGALVSSLSGYITDGQWTNTVSPTLYVKWEANTTIYFVNKDGYTTPYATVQTSGGSSTYKTGGEAMTDAGYNFTSYDVYTYNFPATYTQIGFADGTSASTSAFEASTPYYYDGSWYSSLSAIPLYYVRHPSNVLGSANWATPGTEYMHWKEGHLFYRTYSSLSAANDVEWVLYNHTGGGSYADGNNIFNANGTKSKDTYSTQALPANDMSELKIFLGTDDRFRVNILTASDLTIWYDAANKKIWTTIVESGDPDFYYHGEDNSWGEGVAMTLSTDGMYYYYQHTTEDASHEFKISTLSDDANYPALGAAFVTSGFNSTDVTNWPLSASALQSDGNAICTQSGSYYILLYVPGTAVNTSTQYIICASTTLPDNTPAVNPTYEVTYNAGFGGTVTVTYDGTNTDEATYGSPTVQNMSGTPRKIVATPSTGFSFAGWTTSGGAVISNTASAGARTYANGTGTVTANFTTEGKIFVDLSNITTTYKDAANLYAYFYKGKYWDNSNGTGSSKESAYFLSGPHQMTKITGTNIWYFDYAAAGISPTGYVCFCTHNGNVGNFSSCSATYRGDFNSCTPLFVVHNSSATKNSNAAYYNSGYWRTFDNSNPDPGYYLHLYKYNSASDGYSEVEGSPVELVLDNTLDGSIYKAITPLVNADATGYKFKIASCGDVYYGNNGTYTATSYTSISDGWWDFYDDKNNCGLNVLVDGYDTVFMKFDAGTMKVSVHQPIATNSYRLLYTDGTQTDGLPSYVFDKRAGQENDVSFFIRPGSSPVLKVQQVSAFTASAITWTDVTANILNEAALSKIDEDSIYTIHLTQDASGNINALTSNDVSYYTGNYYIRTDAADGGWGTYMTSPDNLMTYNPASLQYNASNPYDYYFVKWSGANKNVRFVVANDYSPCISDTLITDASGAMSGRENLLTTAGANVRYMWNSKTNAVSRAYLSGSTVASDRFLVLTETAANNSGASVYRIFDKNGNDLNVSGLSTHEALFSDNGNWVYQVDLRVRKGAKATITAKYGDYQPDFVPETILLGETSDVNNFENEGSKTKYSMRMVYDFKTSQFTSSWLIPAGGVSEALALNTDMMIIRNGQDEVDQLTFTSGELTKVDTIYGVMQFDYNEYVGEGSNLSRVTSNSAWTSTDYELNMFYFSFPFDVKMSDIFGIEGYDTYWDIQKYNGAKRAEKGFFRGDGTTTFWETLPMDSTLHAYEGYSLRLSRRDFYDSSKPMWTNKSTGSSIYLYFPSAYSLSGSTISSTSKTIKVPAHTCTINREFWVDTDGDEVQDEGEMLNHQNTDSHWNMVGTPVFENLRASTIGNAPKQTDGITEFKYYYSWNSSSNEWNTEDALTNAVTFNAMGAFLVQYAGSITFNGASIQPASVAARQRAENRNYTITLQLQKGTEQASKTFVELRENANDSFELNEDMYMAGTSKTATVYTYAGNYDCGANVLSVANHTIPVGVNVKQAGTYNFAMPSNFDGTVTLIDKFAQTRTNLALGDYEVTLERGTINDRFELEINISKIPTAIDGVTDGSGSLKDGKAHKFIENGVLYIVKDGEVYDARGNKVK